MRLTLLRIVVLPVVLLAGGCQPAAQQPVGGTVPSAGLVAAPAGDTGRVAPDNSDGAATLIAAYQAAHAKKDVEGMLALYWFGAADDDIRATVRENVVAEMRCPLVDIKVEPVDPAQHGPRVEGGVRWGRSLPVSAMLTADFDTSSAPVGGYHTQQARIMVGRRGGRYYFVVPVRE